MALFKWKAKLLAPALAASDWEATDWIQEQRAPLDLVVGEHRNQDALKKVAAARGHSGTDAGALIPVLVVFRRQPDNPYDSNAWAAEIDDAPIGHLRKTSAAVASAVCDPESLTTFTVAGLLRGGGGGSNFGVHVWPSANLTRAPRLPDDPECNPVPWPPGVLETLTRAEKNAIGCPGCGKWPPNRSQPDQQVTCDRCGEVFVVTLPT